LYSLFESSHTSQCPMIIWEVMFDTNYEFHGDMWKNIVPSKNYNPIKWLNTYIHRHQSLTLTFSLWKCKFSKNINSNKVQTISRTRQDYFDWEPISCFVLLELALPPFTWKDFMSKWGRKLPWMNYVFSCI
jgi:hypothetical protein